MGDYNHAWPVTPLSKTAPQKRQEELQAAWEQNMPCHDCGNKDICRYFNSIKRLDYDPTIFNVKITCNRRIKGGD